MFNQDHALHVCKFSELVEKFLINKTAFKINFVNTDIISYWFSMCTQTLNSFLPLNSTWWYVFEFFFFFFLYKIVNWFLYKNNTRCLKYY